MKNREFSFVLMLLFCGAVLFANGAGEQGASYAGETGRISVYFSGPAPMLDALESGFESVHGDVLDCVHMGCGPMRQRVWTEYRSGGIQADLFWGSDPLLFNQLEAEDALDAYVASNIDEVKEQYRSSGAYGLLCERYGVLIYNEERVAGELIPSSFGDLARQEFDGRIVHADPSQSSTALALLSGLWNVGEEPGSFYRELAKQHLYLSKKNSAVPNKIMEGEFDFGIAPHDAVLRLQRKAKREGYPLSLRICWPEEGALAIQRPIAISKNSARPEENQRIAERFYDYMFSKQAQMIMVKAGFISVREDCPLPRGVPKTLQRLDVDWLELSRQEKEIRDLFRSFFL